MGKIGLPDFPARTASERLIEALRQHVEPLPPPEQHDAFGQFFDRFGDAQIVLLGDVPEEDPDRAGRGPFA